MEASKRNLSARRFCFERAETHLAEPLSGIQGSLSHSYLVPFLILIKKDKTMRGVFRETCGGVAKPHVNTCDVTAGKVAMAELLEFRGEGMILRVDVEVAPFQKRDRAIPESDL